MPNLYKITAKSDASAQNFTDGEVASIAYHDIFDYPLNISEMIRWCSGSKNSLINDFAVISKDGYFFKEGREGLIYKRTLRKRISERKLKIAENASKILSLNPMVKMVAVTGSLAMQNASDDSDVDLMVVTRGGKLWTTRLISHLILSISGFKVRKSGDRDQKDKLCLNIWMDENYLKWQKNKNVYTAHEILQIQPLVNKDKTYERFIYENRWATNFWPNAVKIKKTKAEDSLISKAGLVEKLAYLIQFRHMKAKITRETITPKRALFHPQDWSTIVMSRLSS